MFIEVAEIAINDYALCTQVLCAGAHQTTPTSRVHAFGLRDEDNAVFLNAIGEVFRCLWCRGVVRFDHLNGVSWAKDLCFAGLLLRVRRVDLQAVQISSIRHFQFHESITNLAH